MPTLTAAQRRTAAREGVRRVPRGMPVPSGADEDQRQMGDADPRRAGRRAAADSHRRRIIAGVSQKMLTQTLRTLERDGLVSRTVTARVPVRVDGRRSARRKPDGACERREIVGGGTYRRDRSQPCHLRPSRDPGPSAGVGPSAQNFFSNGKKRGLSLTRRVSADEVGDYGARVGRRRPPAGNARLPRSPGAQGPPPLARSSSGRTPSHR